MSSGRLVDRDAYAVGAGTQLVERVVAIAIGDGGCEDVVVVVKQLHEHTGDFFARVAHIIVVRIFVDSRADAKQAQLHTFGVVVVLVQWVGAVDRGVVNLVVRIDGEYGPAVVQRVVGGVGVRSRVDVLNPRRLGVAGVRIVVKGGDLGSVDLDRIGERNICDHLEGHRLARCQLGNGEGSSTCVIGDGHWGV